MPRIPVHSVENASAAATEALRRLRERMGRVLNIHGEMAHAPAVLAAYTGIQRAIAELGSFDVRTREAIALAVAAVNDCGYCQAAHTGAARRAGWSVDQTLAFRTGMPVEGQGRLEVLLAVARQIAANGGTVDDQQWQQALDAGWTVQELAELFAHVVANVFTNSFNNYARTELDLPPAPPAPPTTANTTGTTNGSPV